MAYEPKTWECGEVVTADALNHLEQGVASASGSLIFTATEREATAEECPDGGYVTEFSHSWQEIHDALEQGQRVVLVTERMGELRQYLIVGALSKEGVYSCLIMTAVFVAQGEYKASIEMVEFADATSKVIIDCDQQ